MRKIIHLILIVLLLVPCSALQASHQPEFSTAGFFELPNSGREVFSMNPAWRFYKGSVAGAEAISFDDTEWAVVSLPNGIEYLPTEASGCINYQGEVWYRKHFTPADALKGKKLFLHFEAIMGKSKVFVNGRLIKEHFGGYWWLAHFCLFLRCQYSVNQCFTIFYSVRQIPNGTKTGQNHRKIKSRTLCSEYPSLNICCTGAKVQICPVKNKSKHLNITGSAHFLFSCIKADNTNGIFSQMRRIIGKECVKICFPSFGRMPGEDVATLRLFCHMIVQKSKPPPAN